MTSPSFTTIAPKGPPRPERTFSIESWIARAIKGLCIGKQVYATSYFQVRSHPRAFVRIGRGLEAFELLIYIFEIAQITPRDAWSHEFASLSLTPDGHTGRNPSPCHSRGRGKDSGGRACRSSSVASPDFRFRCSFNSFQANVPTRAHQRSR